MFIYSGNRSESALLRVALDLAKRFHPHFLTLFFSLAALLDRFGASASGDLERWVLSLTLFIALVARGAYLSARPRPLLENEPFALLLVAALSALLQATGGFSSPLEPFAYLLLALLGAFLTHRAMALALTLFALLEAGGPALAGRIAAERMEVASRLAFGLLFGLLVGALVRYERKRRAEAESVLADLKGDSEALAGGDGFRGKPAPNPASRELAAKELIRSVREMDEALYAVVEAVRRLLSPHACTLYLLDASGERLRLRQAWCESESLDFGRRVQSGEGLVGWVLQQGRPMKAVDLARERHTLPYYKGRTPARSFLAVPVIDAEGTKGVLAVDGLEPGAFSCHDERLLLMAANQVVEVCRSAWIFQRIREERREFEGLYSFSKEIGSKLKTGEILESLLKSAEGIVPFDLGAVVLKEGAERSRLALARGAGTDSLDGVLFPHGASRVGWVLESGQYLLFHNLSRREARRPIFFKKEHLPHLESLLIAPLEAQGETFGALVMGARREGLFTPYEVRLFELVARQSAVSILNARMYERMERMATTDGLTGLANHRFFQQRLAEELRRATRHPQKVSVILCDLDHFKKVNDTHGHPAGDEVLKRLARLLADSVREVDLAARYGGEEFVLILPGTDTTGALKLARRIGASLRKIRVPVGGGVKLKATLSLGVATYPDDAGTKAALLDLADKALYRAKESGRDRTVAWKDISSASPASVSDK